MAEVRQRFGVSERRACRVLGQARTTQRRRSNRSADEEALREDVVKVARRFGRYGYRMVTGMLEDEGLGGEPQAGGADLEAGGAEGAEEAAQAGAFVVDGRLLHPAPGPCTGTTSGPMTSWRTGPTTVGG